MLSCLFQKKSTLLVFCEEGLVVEIDSPEGAKFDTSHTFHITGLPMKQYKFKSIVMFIIEDHTVTMKCRVTIKPLFLYFNFSL
jgi:hypothetical protein